MWSFWRNHQGSSVDGTWTGFDVKQEMIFGIIWLRKKYVLSESKRELLLLELPADIIEMADKITYAHAKK